MSVAVTRGRSDTSAAGHRAPPPDKVRRGVPAIATFRHHNRQPLTENGLALGTVQEAAVKREGPAAEIVRQLVERAEALLGAWR